MKNEIQESIIDQPTAIFNVHDDDDLAYSFRISNVDGLGHLSSFVVVCKVEQNCELEVTVCTLQSNNSSSIHQGK